MATLRFNRAARSNSVSLARDASNSTTATAATTSGAASMKFVQKYLDGCRSFYSCIYCRTHLANHDELISRSFQGNRSRAYLFNTVINVSCGPSVQRELNTGAHSVADIFCANCGTTIGWKYERAFVDSQKYKEGKFIIELAHVVRENRHLELDKRDIFLGLAPPRVDHSPTSATIGTEHRGSLSPASSSGQWSPGTSSSSSSPSSSSPSSSLSPPSTSHHHHHHQRHHAPSKQNCRYSDNLTQASMGDHARANFMAYRHNESHDDDNFQADDIDDDEVLMFPFYDDLYGNRSSYSNLSASRSYQKNMQRRSMYLEASPRNRRPGATHSSGPEGFSCGDAAAASSSVSPSATTSRTTTSGQPLLFSRPSRSIEIPFNHTTTIQAQTDNNNADSSSCSSNSNSSGCRQQKLAASSRLFAASSSSGSPPAHRATVPPQSTSQASNNSLATVAAAQAANRNSSEHAPNSGTSAARNDRAQFSDRHVDEDDTQFQFEHDNKQLEAGDNDERGVLPLVVSNSEICSRNSQNQISSESANEAGGSGFGSCSPGVSGNNDEAIAIGRQERQQLDDGCDDSESPTACRSQAQSNSLSFDDEEFYDCNTDHDVSNSSPFKLK